MQQLVSEHDMMKIVDRITCVEYKQMSETDTCSLLT